jgi:hypothetical protein
MLWDFTETYEKNLSMVVLRGTDPFTPVEVGVEPKP